MNDILCMKDLEMVPVVPVKYCKHCGGPPKLSPQLYWVTYYININISHYTPLYVRSSNRQCEQ